MLLAYELLLAEATPAVLTDPYVNPSHTISSNYTGTTTDIMSTKASISYWALDYYKNCTKSKSNTNSKRTTNLPIHVVPFNLN